MLSSATRDQEATPIILASEKKKVSLISYSIFIILTLILAALTVWGAFVIRYRNIDINDGDDDNNTPKDPFPFRLPETVWPRHYDIEIAPHDDALKFDGVVSIRVEVREATSVIELSAEEMQFIAVIKATDDQKKEHAKNGVLPAVNGKLTGITVRNEKTSAEVDLSGFSTALLQKYRKIQVNTKTALEKGSFYILRIEYQAPIRTDMRGFYSSKAADGSLVLSTQFESEDGRAAIPLFDEPKFKATYQMTITTKMVNEKTKVLFNTDEIERSQLADGRVRVKFDKTPLMSTYLIAFVIGQYDFIEKKDEKGIMHRIYTPVGKAEQGRDALEASIKVTKFFQDTYQVDYPIKKMDHISIPSFASGAMENFGLITYREAYIIFDNATASRLDKENGIEVVSHEVSHQFNGNIITCAFWTHLWLNEGFATFMETYALDNTYPSWRRGLKKLTNSVIYAADADAVPSSDPIVREYTKIQSKDEIDSLFNSITYDKGGAVLNMFFNYLGEENFVKWIRSYFAKYKNQNAETKQLLELIPVTNVQETASNFGTWLYQPGMPIVQVKEDADGSLILSQNRFFSYATADQVDQFKNSSWWIPLTYVTSVDGDVKKIEMSSKTPTLKITEKVYKFNHHKKGFYRINYSTKMWKDLISNIDEFDTEDRFDLFNDMFSIATSTVENIDSSLMFEMLLSLKNDDTSILWENMYQSILKLHQLLAGESVSLSFSRMVRELVTNKYVAIGWSDQPGTDEDEKQNLDELRPFVLNLACRFGHSDCVTEAFKRFQERNTTIIPPILRNAVYRAIISNGGEREYYQILDLFKAEQDSVEKTKLMYSLAYSQQIPLLQNTLELSLSPLVNAQDSIFLIREVARNVPNGPSVAWNFVRSRYDAILSKCGQDQVSNRLVYGVGNLFTSIFQKQELEVFFKPYLEKLSMKHYKNTLEAIEKNAKFLEKHLPAINTYLTQKYPPQY